VQCADSRVFACRMTLGEHALRTGAAGSGRAFGAPFVFLFNIESRHVSCIV
jgi:hypothetical protein